MIKLHGLEVSSCGCKVQGYWINKADSGFRILLDSQNYGLVIAGVPRIEGVCKVAAFGLCVSQVQVPIPSSLRIGCNVEA